MSIHLDFSFKQTNKRNVMNICHSYKNEAGSTRLKQSKNHEIVYY